MGISALQGAHQDPHTLRITGPRSDFIAAPVDPSRHPITFKFGVVAVRTCAHETTLPATSLVGEAQEASNSKESANAVFFTGNPYLFLLRV